MTGKLSLGSLWDRFERLSTYLSQEEQLLLRSLLQDLLAFLETSRNRSPDQTTSKLRAIRSTLATAALRASPRHKDSAALALREVRARIAHGRSVSVDELDLAVDRLWDLLKLTAKRWEPSELSKLLSYALRTDDVIYGHRPLANGRPNIARALTRYQRVYRELPPEIRKQAGKELILRLLSEPIMLDTY